MSRKKERVLEKKKEEKKTRKGFWIELPTPKSDVLISLIEKSDKAEIVIDRYLQTIEKIAKMENDTLLRVSQQKYGFIWKMSILIAALLFLVLGLALGYGIKQRYGEFQFIAEPPISVNKQ